MGKDAYMCCKNDNSRLDELGVIDPDGVWFRRLEMSFLRVGGVYFASDTGMMCA